jgi:hypothetical protein
MQQNKKIHEKGDNTPLLSVTVPQVIRISVKGKNK